MGLSNVNVVIQSFVPSPELLHSSPVKFLSLQLGDLVCVISSDLSGWAFGNVIGKEKEVGMFPQNYVSSIPMSQWSSLGESNLLLMNLWPEAVKASYSKNSSKEKLFSNARQVTSALTGTCECCGNGLYCVHEAEQVNYKNGLGITFDDSDKHNVIELYRRYDNHHTHIVKRLNETNSFDGEYQVSVCANVKFKDDCQYLLKINLVDGRSMTPLYETLTWECQGEVSAIFKYRFISPDEFSKRETTVQVHVYKRQQLQQKIYLTTLYHRLACFALNSSDMVINLEMDSDERDSQAVFHDSLMNLQLKFVNTNMASDVITLNTLKTRETLETRSQSTFTLAFSESFTAHEDIIVQGQLFSDGPSSVNNSFIIRNIDEITFTNTFTTKVLCNSNFKETIEVRLPEVDNHDLHIRFTFYNAADDLIAVSYIDIVKDGVLLIDGRYEVLIYKVDVSTDFRSQNYLKLPSTKREQSNVAISNYSLMESTLTVTTHSISTYLSQNKVLMDFLRFDDETDLIKVIPGLFSANPVDFKYLMPQILDKTFFLLRGNNKVINSAFDLLTYILHWADSGLYPYITLAVDHCLTEFRHPNVASLLLSTLKLKFNEFVQDSENIQVKLAMVKTAGCLDNIVEFILAARICDGKDIKSLASDFKELLALATQAVEIDADVWRFVADIPKLFDPLIAHNVISEEDICLFVQDFIKAMAHTKTLAILGFIGSLAKTSLFKGSQQETALKMTITQLDHLFSTMDYKSVHAELCRIFIGTMTEMITVVKNNKTNRNGMILQFFCASLHPLLHIYLSAANIVTHQRLFTVLFAEMLDLISAELLYNYCKWHKKVDEFVENLSECLYSLSQNSEIPPNWQDLNNRINSIIFSTTVNLFTFASRNVENVKKIGFERLMNTLRAITINTKQNTVLQMRMGKFQRSFWFLNSSQMTSENLILFVETCLIFVGNTQPGVRFFVVPIFVDTKIVEMTEQIIWFLYNDKPELLSAYSNLLEEVINNTFYSPKLSLPRTQLLIIDSLEKILKHRQNSEDSIFYEVAVVRCLNLLLDNQFSELWHKIAINFYNYLLKKEKYAEAGRLIQLFGGQLKWQEEKVPIYVTEALKDVVTKESESEVKEELLLKAAKLFKKAELWELSVEIYKDLIVVHEDILLDYDKIPRLMEKLKSLYHQINTVQRMESHYFLVGFHGNYSELVKERFFIFRGEKLELWDQFRQRILNSFGGEYLDIMKQLDDILKSPKDFKYEKPFISIMPLNQIPSSLYSKMNKAKNPLLAWYPKLFGTSTFELSRPLKMIDSRYFQEEAAEATSLWIRRKRFRTCLPFPTLLCFDQLITVTDLEVMNPVESGISSIKMADEKLHYFYLMIKRGFKELEVSLIGQIRGILNADVGGGIKKYLVFFNSKKLSLRDLDNLNELVGQLQNHVETVGSAVECLREYSPESELLTFFISAYEEYKSTVLKRCEEARIQLNFQQQPLLPQRRSIIHSNVRR